MHPDGLTDGGTTCGNIMKRIAVKRRFRVVAVCLVAMVCLAPAALRTVQQRPVQVRSLQVTRSPKPATIPSFGVASHVPTTRATAKWPSSSRTSMTPSTAMPSMGPPVPGTVPSPTVYPSLPPSTATPVVASTDVTSAAPSTEPSDFDSTTEPTTEGNETIWTTEPTIASSDVEPSVTPTIEETPGSSTNSSEPYRPHSLIVVMDDLGSNDLGYHGSGIKSPVANSIALTGLQLKNMYTLPTCTTTRIALMTGRYPYRMGAYEVVRSESTKGMPLDEETLPQILQTAGYQTHAVGKWHLGHAKYEQSPTYRGFQSYFGFHVAGYQDYFNHSRDGAYDLKWEPREFCGEGCSKAVDRRGQYSAKLYGQQAANIVERHNSTKGPLFLYLAFQSVHTPLQVPEPYYHQYRNRPWSPVRKTYAGMITASDDALGLVRDELKRQNMWDDTLVLYTTDNGGPLRGCVTRNDKEYCNEEQASNWPSKGGKMDVWEGGVLGEAFFGGGALRKLGIRSGVHEPIMHIVDLLPTLLNVTGARRLLKKPLDGVDQLGVLQGGEPVRDTFFLGYSVEKPDQARLGTKNSYTAVRSGKWKLVRAPDRLAYQLFDLENDAGEENDLFADNSLIVQKLMASMAAYEQDFNQPPAKEDASCPARTYGMTSWGEASWEPWC